MNSKQTVQLVQAGVVPRSLYSVPDDSGRPLVIMAGGSYFGAKEAHALVEQSVETLASLSAGSVSGDDVLELSLPGTAGVKVYPVESSWVDLLVPEQRRGTFVQIVPVGRTTIDTPALSSEFAVATAGPWQWLAEDWSYPIPSRSKVATNLAALHGDPVTEVARWEEDYFEAFAGSGPDTPRDEVRFVTMSTLIGHDPSMVEVTRLRVGESTRRESGESPWIEWVGSS